MSNRKLSNSDYDAMDSFLNNVLDWYKSGQITRAAAVSGLAHVMAALNKENAEEAISWFENADISYFKEDG